MVTSNAHKADEIRSYFDGSVEVMDVRLDCPESRDEDVGEIARAKAAFAWKELREPLIVDDTSFSLDALGGFPGPYAAYVFNKIGNEGILRLISGKRNSAHFTTAIAYADENGIRVFRGVLSGIIVEPRGVEGFGYDPIFEWEGKTLAEIPLAEKSRISHRARALANFHDWFIGYTGTR